MTTTQPQVLTFFTMEPAQRWPIANSNGNPVYAGCADCQQPEAEIAGFFAKAPTRNFTEIAVVRSKDSFFVRGACYCVACTAKIMKNGENK
jgi:hypothetical protein